MRSALVALLLALAVPATASAQTDERAARAHFLSGSSYYEQGRYEDALREFEEALRTAPDAQKGLMTFNVGQAQERLGRLEDAIASFRRYLELQPHAQDRSAVEERVRNLEARVAGTSIAVSASEAGARVSIDGHEVGTTPLEAPVRVAPGSHEILVEREGFQPYRLRVSVETGRRAEAEATLVPLASSSSSAEGAAAPSGPASARPRRGGTLKWLTGGLAVAALAGGTVFGVLALDKIGAANDERAGDEEIYLDARDGSETFALVADISFGVALAAGVATVILFLTEGSSEDAPAAVQVGAVPTQGGLSLVLGGSL